MESSKSGSLDLSPEQKQKIAEYLEEQFVTKRKSFLEIDWPESRKRMTLEEFESLANEKTLREFRAVMDTIPKDPKDPKLSLKDLRYDYNEKGELRHMDTGDKFHWVNQIHYDLLGDLIVPHIQKLMMEEFGMIEIGLPEKCELPPHIRSNIFLTPNWETCDVLCLLIQGSGAVRPGQWARALCLNDSIEVGSILPYLRKAHALKWGVIVFNPNQNSVLKEGAFYRPDREEMFIPGKPRPKEGERVRIPENKSPGEHTVYVWDQFGKKSKAKDLIIIAHSAGGYCTLELMGSRKKEVLPKLRGIAFTDSVHSVSSREDKDVRNFLKENAVNWVQSEKPLDAPESSSYSGCTCVSSGHSKHEWTSASAIESVFKYLTSKLK